MKKALPLLLSLLAFSVFSSAQTTTTLTHGSGYCTQNYTRSSLTCGQMTNNDGSHWSFYFVYQLDGSFAGGTVYLVNSVNAVVFSATNFTGTWSNGVVQGSFSAGSVTGTDVEQMKTISHCHRGGCSYSPAVTNGAISYSTN